MRLLDRASLSLDDVSELPTRSARARALLRDLDDHRRGHVAGAAATSSASACSACRRTAEPVDFELTDDQVALQEGVRAFLDGRFPLDDVRAIEAAGVASTATGGASWARPACSPSRCPRPTVGSSSACRRPRSCSRSSGARSCPARSSPPSSPPRWIDGAADRRDDRRSASSRDAGVGGRAPGRPRRAAHARPPTASAGSIPTAIATTARRAPGRRARRRSRSSTGDVPDGDADRRRRPPPSGRASSGIVLTSALQLGLAAARPSSSPPSTPRSASSSAG